MSYNNQYNAPGPQGYHPAYAQPAYIQAPPRGLSVASMVLGISSIVFGWILLVPIVGLVLGIVGLRREPAGKGMAVTGLVLNGLALSGWVLLMVFVFAVFGVAASTVATTPA
ncbi:DUF4190 domain-containing protein [Pseudarthrobacter sp. J64]|uniref:DUF4190 domain-containing protein n=1 Tax=Pseudarthrobacter sp. J64 TaxID=3116485 RepID=UPI002E807D5A|nr:DUF4190 domain-containing protein [Pseudarthrobacter sp. J64]MEE2570187.1 DUF4190 domain-containing protein [Pseudarthrobacter sp. J64]